MRNARRSLPILALLTFPVFSSLAIASEPPKADWQIADPSGDVYIYDERTVLQPPANAANAHMDLTGIQIDGEDEAGLYVTFKLADFRPSGTFICCPQPADVLELAFQVRGYPVEYVLVINSYNTLNPLEPLGFTSSFSRASLCIRLPEGDCLTQGLRTTIDGEANTLRVHLSKNALVGQGQRDFFYGCWFFGCSDFNPQKRAPPGTPLKIIVGDVLTKFQASYHSGDEANPSWYDQAPNSGDAPDYRIAKPMANLQISLTSWEGHRESVEIGGTTPIELSVMNNAPGRRIVDLTAEFEGTPEDVSKFQVKAPESVTVPGQSARNITLFLTSNSAATPLTDVHLILRGRTTTSPDELLYARIRLLPTVSLSTTNPHLYLHSASYDTSLGPLGEPLCGVYGCDYAWLNSMKDDPEDEDVEIRGYPQINGLDGFGYERSVYSFQHAAIRPIAFDETQPIDLNLKMKSDVPVEGELTVTLTTTNTGTLIAMGSQRASLNPSPTIATIPLTVSAADLVLPAEDTAFRLTFNFVFDTTSSHGFLGFGPAGLRIFPAESSLNLPLVPPPEDYDRGTLGALVRLTPLGDRESYVNPGEARLFNVTLLNVGEAQDVAHLNVSIDKPGWSVDVLPGTDYRVGSGESVVFGLLVRAAADAAEGDMGIVRVNATSEAAPQERAFLRFGVISTSGLDLPDDTTTFEIQEDAREKLLSVPEKKNTPAPGATAFLVALIGLAWATRRRRD